jgi:glycosyltransferase involved in cell wall biosynthesis
MHSELRRLKILIIASAYPDEALPANNIFVRDQAEVLSAAFDVAVIAPRVVDWRTVRAAGPRACVTRENGVAVARAWKMLSPGTRRVGASHDAYVSSARLCLRALGPAWQVPSVVNAHTVLPAGGAVVRLWNGRVPFVLTEHTSPFEVHLRKPLDRTLVRRTLSTANRVACVGPDLLSRVLEFEPSCRCEVVGNVVRDSFFTLPPSTSHTSPGHRFLTVGLLTPQKGIDTLLKSIRRLLDEGNSSWVLRIGGDGPDRPKLEEQTKTLGLSEHVRFLGMLDRRRVRDEMWDCDTFVLPSNHETFGLVAAEAMACGKPCVVTRSGGPEAYVSKGCGMVVAPGDAYGLATALGRMVTSNVDLRSAEDIRDNITSRFGERQFLQRMASLYSGVLAEYAARSGAADERL